MKYKKFGRTGLFVSEICLGTMTFGGRGEMWPIIGQLDQAAATNLLRLSVDAGINFVDTADVYSEGESERILGGAIKDLGIARQDVIIATKARGRTGPGPTPSVSPAGTLWMRSRPVSSGSEPIISTSTRFTAPIW
jgi:aryl-alcohol dehydrogenase-like predicted oxidoreductase